jgi:hypothetical protein
MGWYSRAAITLVAFAGAAQTAGAMVKPGRIFEPDMSKNKQ